VSFRKVFLVVTRLSLMTRSMDSGGESCSCSILEASFLDSSPSLKYSNEAYSDNLCPYFCILIFFFFLVDDFLDALPFDCFGLILFGCSGSWLGMVICSTSACVGVVWILYDFYFSFDSMRSSFKVLR